MYICDLFLCYSFSILYILYSNLKTTTTVKNEEIDPLVRTIECDLFEIIKRRENLIFFCGETIRFDPKTKNENELSFSIFGSYLFISIKYIYI